MSQERDAAALERFRRFYDAISRRDIDMYLDGLDEDVELHQAAELLGTKGTFRGKDGAVELLDELAEAFTEIDWRPERVIDLGDERYLVLLHPKGKGRGSGVVLEAEVAHLHEQRDGKTTRVDTYLGWAEALEAAGLSEQDAHTDSP
jgi:ketosteroid isomerase-like protein